jgi:hypothetical protein
VRIKSSLLPYEGNDSWVEDILFDIKTCLMNDQLPELSGSCDYCSYWDAVKKHVVNYEKK